MAWWIPLAIGAGAGLGKGLLDQEEQDRQRKIAAVTARWSPWTGMQAQLPRGSNMLGSVLSGAMAGAMMGKQFGGAEGAAAPAETPLQAPQLTEADYMGTSGQTLGYLGYDPFMQQRIT